MIDKLKLWLVPVVGVLLLLLVGFTSYKVGHNKGVDAGYNNGYNAGYSKGYSDGYSDRNKLAEKQLADAVTANTKTETQIVYQTIPYTGSDVQVHTDPPVVTVEVNGKKQEVVQHQETADLAVKTETQVKIKVPERRWTFGIGTDGKTATYMLKAPIKGAVGAWVAGGKGKVMGGLSISF